MGLGDLFGQSASVLLTVKADTSDAKRAVRELSGVEKEAAKQRLAALEAGNKKLEDTAKGWESTAKRIALVTGATALAKVSLDEYGKTSSEAAKKVAAINGGIETNIKKLLSGIGSAVVAFGPLIGAASRLVGVLGEAAAMVGQIAQGVTTSIHTIQHPAFQGQAQKLALWRAELKYGPGGARWRRVQDPGAWWSEPDSSSPFALITDGMGALRSGYEAISNRVNDPWAVQGSASSAGGGRARTVSDYLGRRGLDAGGFGANSSGTQALAAMGADVDYSRIFGEQLGARINDARQFESDIAKRYRDQRTTMLESMFGTPSQFELYGQLFSTLGGTIGSAMDAWISGTQGAGAAIKQHIAGVRKGTATEAGVNAAKSLAMAATYAVTPGMQFWVPGALKSAAAWGGVAALAGVGASQLGGGVGSPGAPGGGGYSGGGGYAPSAPTPASYQLGSGTPARETIVVVGDPFSDDSPRWRQLKVERTVRGVHGSSGVVDG